MRRMAGLHSRMARLQHEQGDDAEGRKHLAAANKFFEILTQRDPENRRAQRNAKKTRKALQRVEEQQ